MAVKLNDRAYEHAKRLIGEGKFFDRREGGVERPPSLTLTRMTSSKRMVLEYSKWFLG